MAELSIANIDREGEARRFPAHGSATIVSSGALTVSRGIFEPGWRWSTDVGPSMGTASCPVRHLGYVMSGHLALRFDDGTETEIGPGDVVDIPAGHDAWVIGGEPCIFIDVSPEMTRYARAGGAGAEDRHVGIVRRGYDAFNSGDVATLAEIFASDVVQHVPGSGPFAGDHKGRDSVLAYYGRMAELTNGTFRARLVEAHGDGHGHVVAVHHATARRGDRTLDTRGSILFSFVGDKATDLLELHADLAADDAFFT